MAKLWFQNGKLVTRGGKLVLCTDCPCGGGGAVCTNCSGTIPSTWAVTLMGYNTQVGDDCVDCSVVNGTHTLTYFAPCTWRKTLAGCGYNVTIELVVGPGSIRVRVYWGDPDLVGTDFDFWESTFPGPTLDCCASRNLGINFFGCDGDGGGFGAGGTGHCHISGFPYCLQVVPNCGGP